MAGGAGDQINKANSIANTQIGVASTQQQNAAGDYAQFKQLLQPLITQQTSLASGNRQQALAAAFPVLSKLSEGFTGAKQNILNSMPAGAARDRALADLATQTYSSIAGAQAGAVQQAPQTLAGIGSNLGNMSLQEWGAALAGLQGGEATNADAMKAKVQQQASLLNFFGSLAQAAGSAAGPLAKLCWVAEAVFGVGDPRTLLVRAWLISVFGETTRGAIVLRIYRAIGRPVAAAARRSAVLRAVLERTLFAPALRRALAVCEF